MSNDEAFCQRFFAFSKRVPKDVKRFCGICRQHGKMEETRGHICEFKDCECQKCNLVRSRRLVMSQQIRLRRAQDKRFQRTDRPEDADVVPLLTTTQLDNSSNKSPSPPLNGLIIEDDTQQQILDINGKNMCYFCQKCKNHGILVWKKQHKRQCPFTNCNCDFCELIETRRRLDQHLVARQKNEYNNNKVRLRNRTNNNIQQQQQKEEEGEFNNNIKSNSEDEENILLEEPPKKKKSISIEETNNNNIAGTSIEINNNKDIKLQNEPLEALNEQIWRIQNQKQEYLPNKSSSRNSSISSVDSSSILNDISLLEQQKQKKQLLSSNNNYPLLFNNLISPTTTNIISSQTFSTSLPNFLTNEQQQQQQLLLSQTNQLIENNGNLTFLDQILFNYLNNSILSKNNLLPQSSILSPLHCNNENGNLINDNENNFQKNCLLQIISQLLLQEQQKSKIAETIIGAQNQAFLRNIILNGNNININNNLTTIDSSTNFNFLETQQQQELLQNNNNNNECFQNIEQQQQLQIQSAFNIIQSGFGLL